MPSCLCTYIMHFVQTYIRSKNKKNKRIFRRNNMVDFSLSILCYFCMILERLYESVKVNLCFINYFKVLQKRITVCFFYKKRNNTFLLYIFTLKLFKSFILDLMFDFLSENTMNMIIWYVQRVDINNLSKTIFPPVFLFFQLIVHILTIWSLKTCC